MARRPSKHLRPPRPLTGGGAAAALKRDGRWIVRTVPGTSATKQYTCPECFRPVAVGVGHVVAWPDTPGFGVERAVDARRHFHSSCWARRS